MLKKLRLKLVCINMVLLTVMLCVILGLVVHFTQAGLEAESVRMMQAAAAIPSRPGRPDGRKGDFPLPYLIVREDREGRLSAIWGPGYREMSEADLRGLVGHAMAQEGPTGVLTAWQLRFLKLDGPEKCLVFADISQERAALAQLTRTCLLAGCAGFGALLLISFFLARWAVRPVERAWEQQRRFVADASHELKTPLTVIITSAELLQSPGDTPSRQLAANILTEARQMRGLVESLLELARVDSGAAGRDRLPLDLSRLVSDALLPFEALFFERGLSLAEEVEAGITVRGCAPQLRQVAEIFLDNAQKYSAPGGTVTLSLRRKGRARCLLSVSNPGEAIPKEELNNIFKRFYRLDRARSLNGSYGLGLSIARSIVAEHHGKIWAESAGGINTFYVELPAEARQ